MTAAKTPTQRVQALRQRRADLGLVRLDLYAHPDDHATLKAMAAKLLAKREKANGLTNPKPPRPSKSKQL